MISDTRPYKVVFVEKRPLGYWLVSSTLYLDIPEDADERDYQPLAGERAADELEAVAVAFRHCNYYKIPIENIVMHDEWSQYDGMFADEDENP